MFEKMLGKMLDVNMAPGTIEAVLRKVTRRFLVANAPPIPHWYFDRLCKEAGQSKQDVLDSMSINAPSSEVMRKVELECSFSWPWYWADEVLKRENL